VQDPLHHRAPPGTHWTTANLGEAMPGVATPLSATVWGDSVDRGLVAAAYALGALSGSERETIGPPGDRLVRLFHGRAAVKADCLALVGDRMPGTTGEEVVRAFFGEVPETMTFNPTKRRYPLIALRLPTTFALHPRRVRAATAEYDRWWKQSVADLDGADERAARRMLADARERLERAVIVQSVAVMNCVQPPYEALAQTVKDLGAGDLSVLSAPPGGAESVVVRDIWRASRGQIGLDEVVARHGFHGPFEGELSARVWREDPSPLERMVEQYAELGDDQDPEAREGALARARDAEEEKLLAAAPRARRPAIKLVIRLVGTRIPLRGVAKRSMLQSLDVARAAAREIGRNLARAGAVDDPDDVFYLTLDEALAPDPGSLQDLVASRRASRDQHARFVIPECWQGDPPETTLEATSERDTVVKGEGVSTGVVEGTARVVADPAFTEVEPGEILVAPTTDPSWSSIMFVSSALVVDIGGALSHAAVVARELGIPCVVNTRSGSRTLRTGDRVRVDGGAGTVEVLEAA
jgi:rifampicin phosphotransferase